MKGKKFLAVTMASCLVPLIFTGCSLKKESKDIKIGVNIEESGPVAAYGQQSLQGLKLAYEEINKAGGINGKKIVLYEKDNKSDPQEAVSIAKKLISQNDVSAIIGPVTSGGVKAAREVSDKYKVPVISGTATDDSLTVDRNGKTENYVFRTCFTDSFQGRVMAKFLNSDKKLGIKKVALLVDNSNDYSKGLAKYFKQVFKSEGGKIVEEEAFNSNEKDFKAVLAKIKDNNPDAVYLPAYYQAAGMIVNQAREMGMKTVFLGADGFDSPDFLKLVGKKNLYNVYYTTHYSVDIASKNAQAFRKAFKKKYKEEPNTLSALTYDATKLLCDAIKKAKSTDPVKIKEQLAKTKNYDAVTGKFSIDSKHNTIKNAVVIKVEKGTPKYYTTVAP